MIETNPGEFIRNSQHPHVCLRQNHQQSKLQTVDAEQESVRTPNQPQPVVATNVQPDGQAVIGSGCVIRKPVQFRDPQQRIHTEPQRECDPVDFVSGRNV